MLESEKKNHLYLMRLLTTNNIKLHHIKSFMPKQIIIIQNIIL